MARLGTARRVILSACVPALIVACLLQVELRVNERPFDTSGSGVEWRTWDTFVLRDAWWFWPGLIVVFSVWWWVLWPRQTGASEPTHA